jgi:hypothetical protein
MAKQLRNLVQMCIGFKKSAKCPTDGGGNRDRWGGGGGNPTSLGFAFMEGNGISIHLSFVSLSLSSHTSGDMSQDNPNPILQAANAASHNLPREARARIGQTVDPLPPGMQLDAEPKCDGYLCAHTPLA